MDTTTQLSIVGTVFGIVAFIGLCLYIVAINFIFPQYSGTMPVIDMIFYMICLGMGIIGILNAVYAGLAGSGKTSDTMNTAFIATILVLLSIVNVLLGYGEYLAMGTNMNNTVEYLQLLLPANLLISVLAVSMITMHKLSGVI